MGERNNCGTCTLCCDLFPVPDLDKPAFTKCKHCKVNQGCDIYKDRPQNCRDIECAYFQMDPKRVSIKLRPDHCRIVFEKINDRIFFGTRDPNVPPTYIGAAQVKNFTFQGYSVILFHNNKFDIFLADGHKKEDIWKEYEDYLEKNK